MEFLALKQKTVARTGNLAGTCGRCAYYLRKVCLLFAEGVLFSSIPSTPIPPLTCP